MRACSPPGPCAAAGAHPDSREGRVCPAAWSVWHARCTPPGPPPSASPTCSSPRQASEVSHSLSVCPSVCLSLLHLHLIPLLSKCRMQELFLFLPLSVSPIYTYHLPYAIQMPYPYDVQRPYTRFNPCSYLLPCSFPPLDSPFPLA